MESRRLLRWIVFWVGAVNLSCGQEEIPRPKFPEVFQVEIEGIFNDVLAELDASLYYDSRNNRAAAFFTYQKEQNRIIYNFNDNEVLSFDGVECTVDKIPDNPLESFFPFTTDEETGKKNISSPEEMFYFTKSVLKDEAVSAFPVYTYKAKIDIPYYKRENCDVRHIFTRPEMETPDCDSHDCQPKLISISVVCDAIQKEGEERGAINHSYDFYRFKSGIEVEGVFQPPPGVYCNATSRLEFPRLPDYFSFSYDYQEDSLDVGQTRVDTTHKKVWYHSSLQLIRVDEFEENGLLVSSRILDFYSGTAFTTVSHLAKCEKGALEGDIDLSELTRLPRLIFQRDIARGDAVYIGKRKAHGIIYDVWVSSLTSSETDSIRVEEFFFSQVFKDESTTTFQLSHIDIYVYAQNPDTRDFELSVNAFYGLNNFRSAPKEWKAFDISACFEHDHKKAFKLEVEGPSVVKNSFEFESLLEKLYMKIIIYTNVSISRVSDLTDVHDGTHLNGFNGWILEKPDVPGVNGSELEPNMDRAYELLRQASLSGKLNIKMKFSKRDVQYKIKLIEDTYSPLPTPDWAIAAIAVLSVVGVIVISCWILYVVKRKKEDDDDTWNENPLQMGRVN